MSAFFVMGVAASEVRRWESKDDVRLVRENKVRAAGVPPHLHHIQPALNTHLVWQRDHARTSSSPHKHSRLASANH